LVDGRDVLQIRTVDANTSDKWLWMEENGWFSRLGDGEGVTTLHCKNVTMLKMIHNLSHLDKSF
jgi:hypothetical protein